MPLHQAVVPLTFFLPVLNYLFLFLSLCALRLSTRQRQSTVEGHCISCRDRPDKSAIIATKWTIYDRSLSIST